MKSHRRNRLLGIIGSVAGLAVAVALVLYSLRENINLFYTPADIVAGKAPLNKSIRVGGLVVPGSVSRASDSLKVEFTIRDNREQLKVSFSDVLPDLFKEGQGIVATGNLVSQDEFVAATVLAKHDENYMPPEVARALEESGHPVKNDDFDN